MVTCVNFYIMKRTFILLCLMSGLTQGLKRCYKCRSRGDLGSCKDPFLYSNVTTLDQEAGVEAVPCASGWCGKVLEGGANTFKDEEYGTATERICLLRGPSDSEERCAPTLRGKGNSRVVMCFCQGDLCNSADSLPPVTSVLWACLGLVTVLLR